MLSDVICIARQEIHLSSLPDWPRWTKVNSSFSLQPGQLFKAMSEADKPVLGVCLDTNSSIYCSVQTNSLLPVKADGLQANDNDNWQVNKVNWSCSPIMVDVCSNLDGDHFDRQYSAAIFGASFAVFVKSCIIKARVGNNHSNLKEKLKMLLISPEELEKTYENGMEARQICGLETAYRAWKEELAADANISELHLGLQRRETFLQVIIALELLSLECDVASLLDHHFDRLCIWQALDILDQESLPEFLAQVIYPFYKSLLPTKITALANKIEGPINRRTIKPKLRRSHKIRRTPGPSPMHGALKQTLESFRLLHQNSAQRSNSVGDADQRTEPAILAKRSATTGVPQDFQNMGDSSDLVQRTLSRELLYHQSRQIDVSFSSIRKRPVEVRKLQPKRRLFERRRTAFTAAVSAVVSNANGGTAEAITEVDSNENVPTAADQSAVYTEVNLATPRKERTKILSLTDLPAYDEIESTDSD